ncbi:MAG: SUMF1/EgtB/PvdO family nonheme iron enzyme [Chloroflexi bacterium]|nr:SUMF1/EgtB/PvdO family nonheme iron enzyme [Chloroflexota bacterium]
MGNQTNHFDADLTHLEGLLEQIVSLFQQPGTSIQFGGDVRDAIILVGDKNHLQLSRVELEGLNRLQSGAEPARREQIYLTGLLLRETYAPWDRLYVPLSGSMLIRQAFDDLPVRYSEFIVPVDTAAGLGQLTMRPLKDITEAMQSHATFVILGAPGSGKTTTLQKIAFEQGRTCLKNPSGMVPLFVRLSEQRGVDPYSFLQTEWERSVGTPFAQALLSNRLLILADGVNEIPRTARAERLLEWKNFESKYRGGNLLIFSGRTLDYENELGLPRVLVEPLEKEQIIDYLGRHKAQGLESLLDEHAGRLLEIAKIPLNLYVLASLYKIDPKQSFTNLGKLFKAFSDSLFNREKMNQSEPMPVDAMRRALAQMAFQMQEQGEGLTFPLEMARAALPSTVEVKGEPVTIDPACLFRFGRGATILDPNTDLDVRFRHHVLQEYFAAVELQRRFDEGEDLGRLWRARRTVGEMPEAAVGAWDPLPEPPGTGWEVTTILACGLSRAPEKLIEAVRQSNPALAARCIDESGIEKPGTVTVTTSANLLADLYNPDIHLRARLQAGYLLGKIGDPRFAQREINGIGVILPQLMPVPGGEYLIGSKKGEQGSFDREYPQHKVRLNAFSIGKWPVTNAEYACFMAAGGYQDKRYWQTELARRWLQGEDVAGGQFKSYLDSWKILQTWPDVRKGLEENGNFTPSAVEAWVRIAKMSEVELKAWLGKQLSKKSRTQPDKWNDAQYNNPSQPVVAITWFEAQAYCAWLSAVTCKEFRLPSEIEWEAAARGQAARFYPWGDAWDLVKANSLEGRVLKPTPVGAYACAGALGPYGAEDQAGNVYNWTSSLYLPYPYQQGKSEVAEADGERVVRGGSWYNSLGNARCACRDRYNPGNFNYFIGFRLVSPGL